MIRLHIAASNAMIAIIFERVSKLLRHQKHFLMQKHIFLDLVCIDFGTSVKEISLENPFFFQNQKKKCSKLSGDCIVFDDKNAVILIYLFGNRGKCKFWTKFLVTI